jgi:hypothetical protein
VQVPIWKKRQGVEAVPLAVRHGLSRIPCWCRGYSAVFASKHGSSDFWSAVLAKSAITRFFAA